MHNYYDLAVFNTSKNRKYIFLIVIILYSLFALNRIKYAIPITIDGYVISNEVLMIGFVLLFAGVFYGIKTYKNGLGLLVVVYLLFSVFISLFYGNSISGGLYALAQIIIPFFGFLFASRLKSNDISSLVKFIVIISGVYALLTIIISANYNFFSGILGVSELVSYTRFARINMPIGSSITVSYFFDITAPICAVCITKYRKDKFMRFASIISLFLSLIAVFLQGSRAAIIVLLFVALMFFWYNLKNKRKLYYICLFFIIFVIVIIYYAKFGDISRFFNRASTVMESDMTRFDQAMKGLKIFLNHPLFGTGIGTVYSRLESGELQYNGLTILSDPHNAYVMLISEVGIVGTIFIFSFATSLIRKIRKYDSTRHGIFLRKTLLISILIQSLFGSHLINEPNYSVVFWIFLGLYVSINKVKEKMNW